MARPPIVQKLRHDRLLCGQVFRFFVETWNWLTAWVDNVKGDAELDPQKGYLWIDRSNPDAPVVRFMANRLPAGGGETVTPDDVSTELIPDPPSGQSPTGDEGKLQIKGWAGGSPSSTNNLATELTQSGYTSKVVTRASDGTLQYMDIGQLSIPSLPSNTVNVLTAVEYGYYNGDYKIRITTKPLGITNGQFSLGNATYTYIDTIAHSQV